MMLNQPMTLQQCWLIIINDSQQAKVQPLCFPSSSFQLFQSYHLLHSFFLKLTCLGKPECSCFPVPPFSADLGWTAPLCSERMDKQCKNESPITDQMSTHIVTPYQSVTLVADCCLSQQNGLSKITFEKYWYIYIYIYYFLYIKCTIAFWYFTLYH